MYLKRGLFRNKKAQFEQETLFMIIEIVLAVVVLAGMAFFVRDIETNLVFEKNYLARDLALTASTVYAAPGDLTYNYDGATSVETSSWFWFNKKQIPFYMEFKQNKAEVYDEDDTKRNPPANQYYPFAEDLGYNLNYDPTTKSILLQPEISPSQEPLAVYPIFIKEQGKIRVEKGVK